MTDQELALAAAIRAHLRESRLPCADAFTIAQGQGITPGQVAAVAETLGCRIGRCQLGLFGTGHRAKDRLPDPSVAVSEELRAQIEARLEKGRLSCIQAWSIAQQLGRERLEVGEVASVLGVRISRCQLGCFP